MRIYEIVDAEGQLGLLRTIIDNTWAAIAQQAEQQRKAAEQKRAQPAKKPKRIGGMQNKAVKLPPPKPTMTQPQKKGVTQPPTVAPTMTTTNAASIPIANPNAAPNSTVVNPSFGPKTGIIGGANIN